jgi:YidC/Oxa1 family membrane protein insertase
LFDIIGIVWQGFWHLLLNVLVAINSVVGSAAVSIIIFTILMRMLTVPFTLKSLRSSRNMQAVQPLIKKVQREYGKDRAKQQEETMKIYRDYGINPAAGCFPMLLQLPIFFGLFAALSFVLPGNVANVDQAWLANQEVLRSQNILWNSAWVGPGSASDFRQGFGWVSNLGAPDTTWIWPVLSGFFQFIQTRMSIPRRDPDNPVDPQQRMMQNLMQFMPIMIIFVSQGFPAGTVIYWAFSSIFGAVLQYFITGFGSLSELPGLQWLPRREIPKIQPLDPSQAQANGAKRKQGLMGRMMARALEAQEAQKAGQAETATASAGAGTAPASPAAPPKSSRKVSPSTPVRREAPAPSAKSQQKAKSIVSRALESENGNNGAGERFSGNVYASDMKADGAAGEGTRLTNAPTNLPRKRKNKR